VICLRPTDRRGFHEKPPRLQTDAPLLAGPFVCRICIHRSGQDADDGAAGGVYGRRDRYQSRTGQVQISVDRWSTPAERATLIAALLQKGPDGLLKALQDTRPVGRIRTPDTIGYDLHYAAQRPGTDGGRDVVFATDRPISFWEAVNRPRSINYPFTIVQIHVKADGTGEGKLALAARVTGYEDTKMIEVENYDMQPVQLVDVKAEPKHH
jgi:hypothetical protein